MKLQTRTKTGKRRRTNIHLRRLFLVLALLMLVTGTQTSTITPRQALARPLGAPTADNDVYNNIPHDTSSALTVLDNDTPDGGVLSINTVGTPTNGGSVSIVSSTVISYTPNINAVVDYTDTFTYTASDDTSGVSNVATVEVNVTFPPPANNPPEATDDTGATPEDTALTLDVLTNDSDPDAGDILSITAVGATSMGGTATISGTTKILYTPTNLNINYDDVFTYTISDNDLSSTATVTVSVTAVADPVINNPPEATDDTGATPENVTLLLNVLDNDTDPENDALQIESVTAPVEGSVTLSGTTAISYTRHFWARTTPTPSPTLPPTEP